MRRNWSKNPNWSMLRTVCRSPKRSRGCKAVRFTKQPSRGYFFETEERKQLRESVRKFAVQEIEPIAAEVDKKNEFPTVSSLLLATTNYSSPCGRKWVQLDYLVLQHLIHLVVQEWDTLNT